MPFLLDWEAGTTDIDGTNTLTDGGDTVVVTVGTPDNAGNESFSVQSNDPSDPGAPNVLGAYYPDRPTGCLTSAPMEQICGIE